MKLLPVLGKFRRILWQRSCFVIAESWSKIFACEGWNNILFLKSCVLNLKMYRSNEDNLQKALSKKAIHHHHHENTCSNNEKIDYLFLELILSTCIRGKIFVTDIDHLKYFRSIQWEPFIYRRTESICFIYMKTFSKCISSFKKCGWCICAKNTGSCSSKPLNLLHQHGKKWPCMVILGTVSGNSFLNWKKKS